ncbi:PFL_4669 family integrating conjugative element protein [Halorhodospira halophila]|uniref:PFL_4669 family integrating conjugative element protein n=1 Tax=Halorhodospira halophila TaxID=1053 RepID=UPI001913C76C|nr:TIGR03761 family integrating conjugative element protein [Halorhodospira halophila]MBK5942936.1 integrating conjugative element protein [Halorhodospira halophila]
MSRGSFATICSEQQPLAACSSSQKPGGLRGQARMTIQTRQAQRLVHGRSRRQEPHKAEIIGLTRFATLMRGIWNAASRDDPWADWLLLQTHEAVQENRQGLEALREQMDQALQSMPAVEIELAESLRPIQVPLSFTSPYGYMGAYLIAEFDQYARAVLTARHVGLLSRDDSERRLYEGGRLVRGVFHIPQGWRYRAVKRPDLEQPTPAAQQMIEEWGEPPRAIIEGTLRAEVAPAIQADQAAADNDVT